MMLVRPEPAEQLLFLRQRGNVSTMANEPEPVPKKRCKECGDERPETNFRRAGDRRYRISVCSPCLERRYKIADPEKIRERNNRKASAKRLRRPDWTILSDCRSSDNKKKRAGNNLDLEFVAEIIKNGCFYCGETTIKLTLDRKDNSQAHTKENVNSACIRCNMLRGSMPYAAWMHIVPAVREAKELGLFKEWRTQPISRKRPVTNKCQSEQIHSDLAQPVERAAVNRKVLGSSPRVRARRWSKTKEFPPVSEVKKMVEETSLRKVASTLKCSHVAVWKYLKDNEQFAGDSR